MSVLYQTRFSILYLGFSVIGAVFFGALAYLTVRQGGAADPETSQTLGQVGTWACVALFGGLAVACAAMGLAAPRLVLTAQALYFQRPMLFRQRAIALEHIVRLTEARYAIASAQDLTDWTVFDGHEATLHLADGSTVQFTSLEVARYASLLAQLLHHQPRLTTTACPPQRLESYWPGYGWLCFMGLLTGGLLYGLFGT